MVVGPSTNNLAYESRSFDYINFGLQSMKQKNEHSEFEVHIYCQKINICASVQNEMKTSHNH